MTAPRLPTLAVGALSRPDGRATVRSPGMADARRIEYVALDDLPSALVNPKRHDGDLLGASFGRFGVVDVPVIDERTGRLVSGHGRRDQLLVMRAEGAEPPEGVHVDADGRWLVPTVRGWASETDDQAHAAGVAMNRASEAGGWDDRELTELLREMNEHDPFEGLVGTGFDPMILANLLMVTRTAGEVADFDAAAEWVGMPDYEAEVIPWKLVLSFESLAVRDEFLDHYGVRAEVTFTHGDGKVVSASWPRRETARHDTGLRWEGDDPLGVWGVGPEGDGPEGSPDGPESGRNPAAVEPTGEPPRPAHEPADGPLSGTAPPPVEAEGEGEQAAHRAAHGPSEAVA